MRRYGPVITATIAIVAGAWVLSLGLERLMRPSVPDPGQVEGEQAAGASAPVRHITATLFYGSADGTHLVPVQREVAFGATPVEQGRQILLAQLTEPAPEALVSTIPAGATLRSFYVAGQGDAFVDFGPEIAAAHPGGSFAELLTVYTIVNAVTANLPGIRRVQILVNGQEVDTLAGHVDLRRPLARNDALVRETN